MPISSYPKLLAVGHAAIRSLFDPPGNDFLHVQEKVDGSQFSFGIYTQSDGTKRVECRSKGQQINVSNPPNLFAGAVQTAIDLQDKLIPDYTYRGEALCGPRHNTLHYARAPRGNVILFDIEVAPQVYLVPDRLAEEGARLQLDIVPTFWYGKLTAKECSERKQEWFARDSILGGAKVEGFVVKNYQQFTPDGKVMMGKYVSEDFKEAHKLNPDWKPKNEFLEELANNYRTPARWAKAVQHLRDAGQLEGTMRDMPKLITELKRDLEDECKEIIKAQMWSHFNGKLKSRVCQGIAEFYKAHLAEQAAQ